MFACVPPPVSSHQEILQQSVSVEDQQQAMPSSRAPSKTTLHDLLDTLKLLEEEPEKLSDLGKAYHRDKYAWIDEVGTSAAVTPSARADLMYVITMIAQ